MRAATALAYRPGMELEIRAVDPSDDAQLDAVHDVVRRAMTEDGRDWAHPWNKAEMVESFRTSDPAERLEGYAAYDAGRMVGASVAWFFLLDNTQKVWVDVWVVPAERRRGVGSALLGNLERRAREEGRTQLAGESSVPFAEREDGPTMRFAFKNGFRVAITEIYRTLELPLPGGLLEEIGAEAGPLHDGYTIESYVGSVPEPLQPSYCDLFNLLPTEAPSGDFAWEADSMTPEIYRERNALLVRAHRRKFTTVAVRDGRVDAFTDLVETAGETRAAQWYTIVDPAHRGHRLGAAVKVANLAEVIRARPDLTRVDTANAETNANMVAINDRLGFRPVAAVPGFIRYL